MDQQRIYLVERYLPRLDQRAAVSLAERLTAAATAMRDEGAHVWWLASIVLAGEEACFCVFGADSALLVRAANERAAAPFDRIVPGIYVGATS